MSDRARVRVGPTRAEELVEAVTTGGGALVDLGEAEAVVWSGGGPEAHHRDGPLRVLDVTDPEPLPDDHPLWSSPRALVTPHSANPEGLRMAALARRVRSNLERFTAGEPLEGVLDRARGY